MLAVDDHPANRLLLVRQLTRFGHHVTEAKSGKQASNYGKNAIDIVITDCMPDDGLELTRQLREISQTLLLLD
ncbi:response regulator [Providencia rettgeri]|uniref:Response regulator n=1 Tax=Providencia rettgeri TaxID=587 RepID=A0A939NGT0_PRORE|nr:response regulator [Providencia rettgeri]